MEKVFRAAILTSCLVFSAAALSAQTETLTNEKVIEMTGAGLGAEIVADKIKNTAGDFDVSAAALIGLKKAGVSDEAIGLMLEKAREAAAAAAGPSSAENATATAAEFEARNPPAPREALLTAKTVALAKSSLNPSRQELEKALLKRPAWAKYNLTLTRYKERADLWIEIGRVPFSWLSHRYVFRVYDRRSGAIIAAGETTSWGSLAENMAREITQKLDAVSGR